MRLHQLSDNPGARKNRIRVGRGIGSGKGKTAGRGGKGQTARTGVSINGFEGGQMPLHMRMPKRGFNPPDRKRLTWINVGDLQKAIDNKRLDAKNDITEDALVASGLLRRKKDGVRLLARGELKAKVNITVSGASAAAVAAVEKAGGKVTVLNPPAADEASTA